MSKQITAKRAVIILLMEALILASCASFLFNSYGQAGLNDSTVKSNLLTNGGLGNTMQDGIVVDIYGFIHVFYSDDGANHGMYYKTSDDGGQTWGAEQTVYQGQYDDYARFFDIEYEERWNTIYFVRFDANYGDLYFKGAIPQADGTIAWNGSWTTVYLGGSTIGYGSIAVLDDGKILIIASRYVSTYKIYSWLSTNTAGTGWNALKNVEVNAQGYISTEVVLMSNNQVMLIYYCYTASPRIIYYKMFDQTTNTWGGRTTIDSNAEMYARVTCGYIRGQDAIILMYAEFSTKDAEYRYYDSGVWSAPANLYTGTDFDLASTNNDFATNSSYLWIVDQAGDDVYLANWSFTSMSFSVTSPQTLWEENSYLGWNHAMTDVNTVGNRLLCWVQMQGASPNGDILFTSLLLPAVGDTLTIVNIDGVNCSEVEWIYVNVTVDNSNIGEFDYVDVVFNQSSLNIAFYYVNGSGFGTLRNPSGFMGFDASNSMKTDVDSDTLTVSFFVRHNLNITQAGWFDVDSFANATGIEDTHNETNVYFLTIRTPTAPFYLHGVGVNATIPYVWLKWEHDNQTITDLYETLNSSNAISWLSINTTANLEHLEYSVVNGTRAYYKVRACRDTGTGWKNSTYSDINFERVNFVFGVGSSVGSPSAPIDNRQGLLLLILLSGIIFMLFKGFRR